MPSPLNKLRTGKQNDGRRKITPEQRERIKSKFAAGMSRHQIAREENIDRRNINWILDPESYKAWQEARYKDKPWTKYYDKNKHREYMRKHRAKIKKLHSENKIT